jgi:hypothetical protein
MGAGFFRMATTNARIFLFLFLFRLLMRRYYSDDLCERTNTSELRADRGLDEKGSLLAAAAAAADFVTPYISPRRLISSRVWRLRSYSTRTSKRWWLWLLLLLFPQGTEDRAVRGAWREGTPRSVLLVHSIMRRTTTTTTRTRIPKKKSAANVITIS